MFKAINAFLELILSFLRKGPNSMHLHHMVGGKWQWAHSILGSFDYPGGGVLPNPKKLHGMPALTAHRSQSGSSPCPRPSTADLHITHGCGMKTGQQPIGFLGVITPESRMMLVT